MAQLEKKIDNNEGSWYYLQVLREFGRCNGLSPVVEEVQGCLTRSGRGNPFVPPIRSNPKVPSAWVTRYREWLEQWLLARHHRKVR
jgi:hypothetical protein